MSINSLTDSELRNSKDFQKAAKGIVDKVAPERLALAVHAEAAKDNGVTNALSMLVKYIPTESITLYVAAISAAPALKSFSPRIEPLTIYGFFGIFTPLLFLLIYFGKRRALNLPTIPSLGDWPLWKTTAATIAFLVWALAVPNSPFMTGEIKGAVAGFLAIFVSTILSVLEPIFDRQSNP